MTNNCDEVVILDFETTGLSAHYDRIIEVGAIIVKDNKVTNSFEQLMNPGRYISSTITKITGITRSMLQDKPRPEVVMPKLKQFIGDRVILAHNASFDQKFLDSEMNKAGLTIDNPILCTLLLSRRLIPNIYNYKLATIANHLQIKVDRAHRALDDVLTTAKVWEHLQQVVRRSTGLTSPDHKILTRISKTPKASVNTYMQNIRANLQ
ncbi:MAG: 3'-5' exonuclease [Bacteriovoracaceae bacterium]|nr:3'-5' exonuclease [Bacteriovoracaceae bacterium]